MRKVFLALILALSLLATSVSAGQIVPNATYTNISLIVPVYTGSPVSQWIIGYEREYLSEDYAVSERYIATYSSDLTTRLHGFRSVDLDVSGSVEYQFYSPSEVGDYRFDIVYNPETNDVYYYLTRNSGSSGQCGIYKVTYKDVNIGLDSYVISEISSEAWGSNWCYDQIGEVTNLNKPSIVMVPNILLRKSPSTSIRYIGAGFAYDISIPADTVSIRRIRFWNDTANNINVFIFEGEVSGYGYYIWAYFYDYDWNYLDRQPIINVAGASKPYIIKVGNYFYVSWIYNESSYVIDIFEPDSPTHWTVVDEQVITPPEYSGSPLTAVALAYNSDDDNIYIFYAFEDEGIYYTTYTEATTTTTTTTTTLPPPVPGISGCGVVLYAPGEYYLTSDLDATSGDYCIKINSSDVELNLLGHTITSYGVPVGIMVEGGISNVKIYNGKITNFEYGIAVHDTTDYEIYSLDLSGNIWGLYTHLADEGTVSQIYFEGTGGAIKIEACSNMLFSNLELKSTGSKPAIYAFGLTNSTLIDVKVGYIERTTAEGETISGWDFKEGTYEVKDVSACPDKAIDCRSCIGNKIVRGYFCGRLVFDEYSRENIIAKPTFDFVGKELMAIEFLKGDLDYNNTICGGQYAMEGEMVCNAQTEVCTYDLDFISVVDYIYDHNQGLTGNIYKDKCYGIYIPGACKDEVGYVCLNTTTRAYVTQDCTYINVRNCEAYQICQNGVCVNTTGLQGTGLLIGDLLSSTTNVVGLSLGIDTSLAKYVTWFIIGMAVGIAIGYYVSPAWGIIAFSSLLGIGAMIGWFPVWYAVIMIVVTALLFASGLGRTILGVGGG